MSDGLMRLRDRARNQIVLILQFAEKISETTTEEDIKSRCEILDDRYQTFNEIELQSFEEPTYEPITGVVDEVYYKARALLNKACGNNREQTNARKDLNATLGQFIDQQRTFYEGVNISQHVRLPKLDIEKFAGDYKQWASFYDLFVSTVHSNQKITNVHKLQMLKGVITGEAAALIRHIPVTENNYEEAWGKLCKRYNKMTPIVSSLIQSFFESFGKDFPTFESMLRFLNKRCDALEICDAAVKGSSKKSSLTSFVSTSSNNTVECIACRQQHLIFRCPVFNNQTVEARTNFVNEKELCCNCLRRGHNTTKCFSKLSCRLCNGRHHTLLHKSHSGTQPGSSEASTYLSLNESLCKAPTDTEPSPNNTNNQTANIQVLHSHFASPVTVLPTAIVYVESRTGELQPYRALLDSGSQSSFVTEHCAQRLDLKRSQASTTVYGLASTSAGTTTERIDITIHSHVDKRYIFNVSCHVIKNITSLLPTNHIVYNKNQIAGFQLTDPQFATPNKIDILLEVDVFFKVLNPESRTIEGLPSLQSTKLSWLIAGTWNAPAPSTCNLHATAEPTFEPTNEEIHHLLHKFWEVKEVAQPVKQRESSHPCETYYEQTTVAMERKFSRMPEFFEAYKLFMNEYIALGHMTYIPSEKIPTRDDEKYYLPHHAVIKVSSTTTKLRVIFDASCKTSSQVSLNDILHIGPNIQTDLTTNLLKFRRHAIALVADVEKMYRQIYVNSDDANYQLILWRENPTDQVNVYKLNTVTYGTACAPYLAVNTLKKSAEPYEYLYPQAAYVIRNDFYIDDLFTGCETIPQAVELKNQICEILSNSGFNLRKWKLNSHDFLDTFSEKQIENTPKLIEDCATIKTLGIVWNSETDTFSFKVQQDESKISWTIRKILSTASKVYDPLGWLAPTIILFKILLQKLWLLKFEWDASLPNHIINSWQMVYQSLPTLEKIQIPRCLTSIQNPTTVQLHAFCDASEAAYGCFLYLRTVNEIGELSINILSAKSKVAPIKQITLPRLELCGAVLLCKSVNSCIKSLQYETINVFAWTDSMIVLHWISDVPRRWKNFIGNRASFILESIPRSKWQHVPSKQNPADAISRGVKPQDLVKSQLWWNGPSWLREPEHSWPTTKSIPISSQDMDLEERPKYINVLTEISHEDDIVTNLIIKHSSWFKIRKIMVYSI